MVSPETSAWPPIGVLQEPSSSARNARSQATAVEGVGVIDARQHLAHARVVLARLDADGALPDRRQEFVHAHDPGRVLRQPEPLHAGERQQRGVDLAVVELAQPRLHVAAQRRHLQVRPQPLGNRLPPQRGGAERGALRQFGERCALCG